MTNEQIKEALSRQYVSSIAHLHGVKCLHPEPDNGVDVTFCPVSKIVAPDQSVRYLDSQYKLDVQIKSTTVHAASLIKIFPSHIEYKLEAKTYNDLIYRRDDFIPLWLVLVIFDNEPTACLTVAPDALSYLGKAYWYRPSSGDLITNKLKTRVKITIPVANILDVNFVQMAYLSSGITI